MRLDKPNVRVRGQVWLRMSSQVWDRVWDRVLIQVRDQVWLRMSSQVWDRVWDRTRREP